MPNISYPDRVSDQVKRQENHRAVQDGNLKFSAQSEQDPDLLIRGLICNRNLAGQPAELYLL